ncbi:hypothetical protein [Mycobacterium sp.]|uniref:hypothetical protein n=1 Tax=Mycobacterium sp. TaxID=1785 RepID=UPI001216282B|nr:hypothetical protein [Mycobacterium sp.]TAM68295.1 MAG: hypothetical protein EPN51_11985 [Mycobacterium sp.]
MNTDQLAALLGAAAAAPRMRDAACRNETWLSDVEARSCRATIDSGIDVCLGCRHMQQCSDWVDSLPADQRPRGVVAGRLVDPDAYQTAKAAMAADMAGRQPKPERQPKPSRPVRRLRQKILAAVDSAGAEGVTVREAAVALYGADPTGTCVELARQAIQRLIARGVLHRVSSGGRGLARYGRVDALEAAS